MQLQIFIPVFVKIIFIYVSRAKIIGVAAIKPASNDFAYLFSTFPNFNVIMCATSL